MDSSEARARCSIARSIVPLSGSKYTPANKPRRHDGEGKTRTHTRTFDFPPKVSNIHDPKEVLYPFSRPLGVSVGGSECPRASSGDPPVHVGDDPAGAAGVERRHEAQEERCGRAWRIITR